MVPEQEIYKYGVQHAVNNEVPSKLGGIGAESETGKQAGEAAAGHRWLRFGLVEK